MYQLYVNIYMFRSFPRAPLGIFYPMGCPVRMAPMILISVKVVMRYPLLFISGRLVVISCGFLQVLYCQMSLMYRRAGSSKLLVANTQGARSPKNAALCPVARCSPLCRLPLRPFCRLPLLRRSARTARTPGRRCRAEKGTGVMKDLSRMLVIFVSMLRVMYMLG
jgi:hypothetical protein